MSLAVLCSKLQPWFNRAGPGGGSPEHPPKGQRGLGGLHSVSPWPTGSWPSVLCRSHSLGENPVIPPQVELGDISSATLSPGAVPPPPAPPSSSPSWHQQRFVPFTRRGGVIGEQLTPGNVGSHLPNTHSSPCPIPPGHGGLLALPPPGGDCPGHLPGVTRGTPSPPPARGGETRRDGGSRAIKASSPPGWDGTELPAGRGQGRTRCRRDPAGGCSGACCSWPSPGAPLLSPGQPRLCRGSRAPCGPHGAVPSFFSRGLERRVRGSGNPLPPPPPRAPRAHGGTP